MVAGCVVRGGHAAEVAGGGAGNRGGEGTGWLGGVRDLEHVAVVELVSLGDAVAFFPAPDRGDQAVVPGQGVAGEGAGFAELAGHLLDVPAPGLPLFPQPLAASAGMRARHYQCLAAVMRPEGWSFMVFLRGRE